MFILDQYIELWCVYGKESQEGEQIEVTVQMIAETFFCTERNSKLIIKKLEELRWIAWFPGRGRGNRSKLIFKKQPMTLILERGKELTKKGDVKSGISFVERYSLQFPLVKKEYEAWMDSIFGHKIERTSEGRRDVLRLQVQMNLDIALDPVYATMRSECHMVKHIFDTLVYVNEETNSIEPRLAFQWEYDDAEKVWTFYLRKGVRLHNGKRLTAHHVIHSLKRFMKAENNPHAWMLQHVESFRAVDEFVVEIQLHTENRMFLHMLSAEQCSIVKEDEAGNFIGTGPFILQEKNTHLFALEVHDLYYRERPFLDRIELLNVEQNVNTYDVLEKAQYKDKENLNKELSRLESNVTYVTCNLVKEGPMQDELFRKALYKIIHGDKIVQELGRERGEMAKKLILANESIVDIDEDIQSLIKRSTYHSEVLQLYTFTGRDHVEDAQWIQKECAKYGIRVETNFLEIEGLLEISTIQKADMMHDSATISERIEDSLLYMFLTKNSFIHGQSSVDFHKSLSPYFKQEQVEKRVTLLRDIEETLLRQIQVIPLYRNKQQVTSHEKVQNIMINSQGWIDFYRIWFKP
ncbi:bacterial extracellular solute-binding s, 5 Middle family protein [Bacillus cereus ATCC 4342]|uniref:ABC transporter substrate-binding protein n=1 Tax=Bacillus tropicus TaxID=2026188 RepID=UPI0001A013E6|nr:SgrR family transcriptional regulator [Bacillus tropicus]AJH76118.1 bacterial extracellular solute-binding s, 5 Middle family protein [Bacillus cereus ATCC 4342]EEK83703.1 Oligopeptide-binding protein oppA [Bacillus cereus ATCC 4342]KFM86269.1 bacterial extracellular solute-binding s, 5 Middle family protein [Bacillus cereus ATCC 4342]MDR4453663.1 SgrR family transcriptional regulator [Bacillus tropicus]QKH57267.1 SgrR family transcriptional regulator [Bacillus tropicus]